MREVYRLKKGTLESTDIKLPIDFGLVYEDDGTFIVDVYINESFNLSEFSKRRYDEQDTTSFNCHCKTDKNNKIEITTLHFTMTVPYESKISMICYGSITHTELTDFPTTPDELTEEPHKLHYLELEGLKMTFTDVTEQIRARGGEKISDGKDLKRDHTRALLVADRFPYNQVFYKDSNSDNIIVEFPNNSNNTLLYKTFIELKRDYVSALSFLNGAEVKVRAEFTGYYYSVGKIDSQISITYSFKRIVNGRHNDYIPLRSHLNIGQNILNRFFIFSFDKYREWNKALDLNSIVFYLSNAEQSKGIEDRFFIQIIAFERLAAKYVDTLNEKEAFASDPEKFETVKGLILDVIERHKGIFGKHINSIKGRIGDLNIVRRKRTEEKFLSIIEDAKIDLTPDLENLVRVVRHNAIHKGEIGQADDIVKNCILLDQLLRDIILNLVEYERGNEKK
jgi:hypothetical protein